MTPIGVIARGLLAGVVGTLAMDLLLFGCDRRDRGERDFAAWELSAELSGWEPAPTPAQVGKRLIPGLAQLRSLRETFQRQHNEGPE